MTITNDVVKRARSKYNVPILTRSEWGSKHPGIYETRRKTKPVTRLKADTLVKHITVTLDTGPLTGNFITDMQTVERIGVERFGSGVSYNWVQDMYTGLFGVGQPLDAKGTHTVNDKNVPGYSRDQNAVARAVAGLGMPGYSYSKDAFRNCAGLIAAMIDVGALTEDFDYKPHSFFAYKDCPCDPMRNALFEEKKLAQALRKVSSSVHIDTAISSTKKAINANQKAPKKLNHLETALAELQSAKKL